VIFIVGFCGVFGNLEHSIEDMSQKLFFNGGEKSDKYRDENLEMELVLFSKSDEVQPVENKDGYLWWVWGDIYGYEHKGEYIKKERDDISDSKYLFVLYDEYGDEIFRKLNGEFAGVKYDREDKKLSLITDRLSTHPIFFTKTETGNLIFSTNIQSIPLYPEVETSFDKNYLSHFFTFERVLGTKTVLEDVEQVHPGSILSYDLKSGKINNSIYWSPKYEPKDNSYSRIVEEFTELFRDVIRERINEDLTYGLYLSGGSDSRLLLATINDVFPDYGFSIAPE